MADTQTRTESLLIETVFLDGDTRTLTIKNPRDTITINSITELNSFLRESKILIGDRDASEFNKIKTVKRRRTAVTKLDLDVRD